MNTKSKKGRAQLSARRTKGRTPESAARLIASLFRHEAVPSFVTDALTRALTYATEQTGIEHFDEQKGDFDMIRLAGLLAVARERGVRFRREDEAPSLPELLSAVLRHEETPEEVSDAILDAMVVEISDLTSPEYLRFALAARQEGGAR